MKTVRCPGCNGPFPDVDGPTHPYMESCPGCWAAYGRLLALEYSDPAYRACHRLTVDAYAVQHPGQPGPKSSQSVALHLLSLCLVLERGSSMRAATDAIGRRARTKRQWPWFPPPLSRGRVTVADVLAAPDAASHAEAVRQWAQSAWDAWEAFHPQVRRWIE